MAANVVEEQPAQAIADEFLDSSPEYQIPETKSSVSNKKVPNAPDPRFRKGDLVHKPAIVNGKRTKIVYTIYASRYNPGGYTEYQVTNVYTNKLEGVWIREKDLKAGG
ncbi:hypothetical protein PtrSN002B_010100 [Pyrenophora tritici-repentis]|uniref:Uncharacterized protein n=2 Tax=Pyrenophora tritici-repentis TaxID=45151 RepID=A0A2W1D8U3_9PLEO|nr:uncharacterized protein PTRG_03343 [Pyrenophora tritici-repentis Pt-1C-BFP]KAA8622557.1 hypothetical protein PtrV1_03863 [Pyrenophora tritici-repentis]EDU45866.1 hypothetical protein PTRG_03343 [Pyrenophora tritici-repentis Pt-1C-BFP]KAF7451545.1 hypothetical protein A1F99_033220 [Pyrenophora tritici-repentis]KAF7575345.1 hypothetical protein PtrM4_069690 [Pyrenophora tritici-repentis]KAG9385905.1 hypothetical protein A1F94_002655 [Pyrenophora tritici-repentis]